MNDKNDDTHTLEEMRAAAIESHLGDISNLPAALASYVRDVYSDFVQGYLNLLRQKENRPRDWFPVTWSLDRELADDMRHFFSDYQHFRILRPKLMGVWASYRAYPFGPLGLHFKLKAGIQ